MCKEAQYGELFDYSLTLRGTVEITGVKAYCECLHIPETIGNRPVTTVKIPNDRNTEFLHQIITRGPVRLQMDWNRPSLNSLDLCEGTILVQPPNGIETSAWFREQPDGAVYLGNWYCGWKGPQEEENLVLQPGTVGVIKDADRERPWKKVVFPVAVSYIGSGAFLKAEEAVTNEHASLEFPLGTPAVCRSVESAYFQRELPLEKLNGSRLYRIANKSEIRGQICWKWMASVPKLTYEDSGWKAEVRYVSEDGREIGYTASYAIPYDSKTLRWKKETRRDDPPVVHGVWSEAYAPLCWMAMDYLDVAAALIRSGEKPTEEILDKLEKWRTQLEAR